MPFAVQSNVVPNNSNRSDDRPFQRICCQRSYGVLIAGCHQVACCYRLQIYPSRLAALLERWFAGAVERQPIDMCVIWLSMDLSVVELKLIVESMLRQVFAIVIRSFLGSIQADVRKHVKRRAKLCRKSRLILWTSNYEPCAVPVKHR